MSDRRCKDFDWSVRTEERAAAGNGACFEGAQLAVLMDIRDELQQLNRLLGCHHVAKGFRALTRIARLDGKAFQRRVDAAVRRRLKAKT